MVENWFKILFLVLLACFGSVEESAAQNDKEHIEVALRMIGHQLLLNSDDSTSRVLPIESEKEKFRINFASGFRFTPNEMVSTIDSVIRVTKIAESYRVEVENVNDKNIVYSYEVDSSNNVVIPCGPRPQPKAKYSLLISLLNSDIDAEEYLANRESLEESTVLKETSSSKGLVSVVILLLILLAIVIYFWRTKNRSKESASFTQIGKYRFDQRNMKLTFKKESIDLTSKETDLLTLLHSSMDVTIEREEILKVVWGDEGDYVGRTLDVFISKLRKKFSEDENVRIVNVRGVGYKLMLSA